ncbi:MAG TPA: alpha/beta fold hydrolase, partial [Phnomibacter sp.]|nr:alpha/beta fold hydrolase [Phnomibacter sp.]
MKALSILLLLIGYSALVPLITHAHPTPVIFVHGMLGAGDNYHHLAHRLHQAGWPAAFLHAFNWNTLARGNTAEKLDSLVNRVLAQTGQRQVVLAGHSAGGGVCYQYMNDSGRAAKVYKYVHIASTAAKTLPGPAAAPIPTLNLFSQADYVVRSASIVGAVNKAFASMDHFGIVSGDSTA